MPDRGQHLLHRGRLVDERRNPGLQRAEENVVLPPRRQDHDAEVDVPVAQLAGQPQPVAVRQADRDRHHVGPFHAEHLPGLRCGIALRHHLNVGVPTGQFPQCISNESLIFYHNKAKCHRWSPPGCTCKCPSRGDVGRQAVRPQIWATDLQYNACSGCGILRIEGANWSEPERAGDPDSSTGDGLP